MLWLIIASAVVPGQTAVPLGPKQAELSAWKRYTVAGERFSVMLPTVPAMSTENPFQPALERTRRERTLGAYADGVVYSIFVYENIAKQSLDAFIAEQLQGANRDYTERTVSNNGIKGEEYSSRDNSFPRVIQYFSFDGYLFRFGAGGDGADEAHVKQFFSSIVLSKKVEGVEVSDGIGVPFRPPDNEPAFTGREVDRRIRLMMKPEPSYTEEARQKEVVGTVLLKVVFSSSGSVEGIRIVSGLPSGLTEKAVQAAKKIKFCPAIKDGKYVAMWINLEYNFNLY